MSLLASNPSLQQLRFLSLDNQFFYGLAHKIVRIFRLLVENFAKLEAVTIVIGDPYGFPTSAKQDYQGPITFHDKGESSWFHAVHASKILLEFKLYLDQAEMNDRNFKLEQKHIFRGGVKMAI
jgi:hypothetical protein